MTLCETHAPVSDLAASGIFHSDVVGLELAPEQAHGSAAYMWTGAREKGKLGLERVQAGPVSARTDISVHPPVQALVMFTAVATDSSRSVCLARLRRRDIRKETESLYAEPSPEAAP